MRRAPKLAQQVADRIEREILDQRLPRGHRLGAEGDLTARYGVSRAVLREAIRLVERHQLAETRRGAGGGLFVSQPAGEAVARVMCAYLESIGLEVRELFEAQRLIEQPVVHFAAVRGSREQAQELEEILLEHPESISIEEDAELFRRFNAKLGELSKSPVLALYAQTLRGAAVHIGMGLQFSKADQRATFRVFWERYAAIARAIATHEAERAETQLLDFLDFNEREWLARRRRTRRAIDTPKRGDALAREMSEEIYRRGLEPGTPLGTEAELTAYYEVSRAAFREAVRLLEQHGVAEMLRGHGLVIAEPDPGAVTRSASAYFAHLKLSVESLSEARLALEPAAATHAAERASDDQLAELVGELGIFLSLEESQTADAARALHEHIAALAGSRALMLFTRVSIAASWGLNQIPRRELPRDALETIRGNYTRIVGAIHDRDAERARRLMRDHIELSIEWARARNRP